MPKKNATKEPFEFHGFQTPKYTQVPDELFDELLAVLSGAELKVLLYIIRRTFGFKKDSDNISLNQICNGIITKDNRILDRGTGLSQSTVQLALKGLADKSIVLSTRRQSAEKGNEPTTYSLHIVPFTENRQRGGTKIGEGGHRNSDKPLHLKSATQQTVDIQQTELQQTVRQQNTRVVDDLIKIGITEFEAIRITNAYPEDQILETLHLVRWLGEHEPQEIKKTPAAFFVWALKGEYDPPTSYQTRADQIAEEEKHQRMANCTICEGRGVYESEKQTSSGRSVMVRCDHSGRKREITVGFT